MTALTQFALGQQALRSERDRQGALRQATAPTIRLRVEPGEPESPCTTAAARFAETRSQLGKQAQRIELCARCGEIGNQPAAEILSPSVRQLVEQRSPRKRVSSRRPRRSMPAAMARSRSVRRATTPQHEADRDQSMLAEHEHVAHLERAAEQHDLERRPTAAITSGRRERAGP